MTDTRASGWKTDAMLLFVTLVWGCNFPVIKAVLAVMPAHAMNAVRLLISALVLGGYYAVQGRRQGTPLLAPLRQAPGVLLALGLLGYFLYQVAFIVGLDHTAAGSAAIIMASVPLWSALVGHTFGFERLRRLGWAGLLVTLVGTTLIVVFGPRTVDFGGGVLFGNVVMVGAAVCWGCYTALNRPVLRRVSPLALSLFGLLFSLPLLFLVALPSFDEIAWGRVNGWTWAALLYSGGLSTGLAPVLWSASVHRVGAAHTTAFGNLVPFIALFAGFFFLDEPINLAQLLGGGLIIAGIMLVRRVRGTARPPARV